MADQAKNQNENAEKYESFHADGLFWPAAGFVLGAA